MSQTKKFLYVNRKAPYGTIYPLESLEVVLIGAAFEQDVSLANAYDKLEPQEREMLSQLYAFRELLKAAAEPFDPSAIANFCYDLAKAYHRFYHDFSILNADTAPAKAFRLQLSRAVANVLKQGMSLLGIDMPERM